MASLLQNQFTSPLQHNAAVIILWCTSISTFLQSTPPPHLPTFLTIWNIEVYDPYEKVLW